MHLLPEEFHIKQKQTVVTFQLELFITVLVTVGVTFCCFSVDSSNTLPDTV